MSGPLSDERLAEIQARGADVGCPDCGCRDEQMHQLGDVDVPAMVAEVRRLRAELDDAAGYLAALHRHASRHDVLGVDLGCAGCALLARIEGGAEP